MGAAHKIRLHKVYTAEAFDPKLLELTERLVKINPWRMPAVEEQERLLRTWLHGAEIVTTVPAPQVHIDPFARNQRGPQPGEFHRSKTGDVRDAVLLLRKCSLISLFHQYRHHMQAIAELDLDDPKVGEDAQAWACSLFYCVAPRRFRRMVRAGRVIGVTERDLLKRGGKK